MLRLGGATGSVDARSARCDRLLTAVGHDYAVVTSTFAKTIENVPGFATASHQVDGADYGPSSNAFAPAMIGVRAPGRLPGARPLRSSKPESLPRRARNDYALGEPEHRRADRATETRVERRR